MNVELQRALYNITSPADLGQEVISAENFSVKMQSLLHVIMGTFLSGKGAIFLYEKCEGIMVPAAHKGICEIGPLQLSSLGTLLSIQKNELAISETPGSWLPYAR